MSVDPFDYRCHRCGTPLLDDVVFCSVACEQAPTCWDVWCAWWRRVHHWLFDDAGRDPETLWSLALADLAPAHRPVVADWLQMHRVDVDRVVWPVQVRRERDGAYLVDAGTLRTPLILPPPSLPGTQVSGTVRRRDTASPNREAQP